MEKNLTFKDKYKLCKTWQEKANVIYLYHTLMHIKYPAWVITDTASHFEVSIGLVSENIKLANEMDAGNKRVIAAITREEALKHLPKRRYAEERNGFKLFIDDEDDED